MNAKTKPPFFRRRMKSDAPPRRYRVARHIGVLLPIVTRKAFGRKSIAEQRLLLQWRAIVGEEWARHSLPLRLLRGQDKRGGTLRIHADKGTALLMQHEAPRIIERINESGGYPLVARLTFLQAPLPQTSAPQPSSLQPPSPQPQRKPAPPRKPLPSGFTPPELADIRHPPLRATLRHLAASLARRPEH